MTTRFPILPKITPENIDLEQLCTSFVYFVQALWYDRGLDKVAPLSEGELEACAWAAGEHPDFQPAPPARGVLAFRGEGKSTSIAAALPCYRYLRDSRREVFCCSKADTAAKKTLHMTRKWLDSVWFLRHLAPRADQKDNTSSFYIGTSEGENRQPSMSCMGLSGQLENNRGHTVMFDDIETKANSKTLEGREFLERLVGEGKNIIYPNRPHAQGGPIDPVEIIVLGTVKHPETLYKKLAAKGYEFMTFPIIAPEPDWEIIRLAPTIQRRMHAGELRPGEPAFGHRFGVRDIAERQREGRLEFMMESVCVVGLADSHRYPLRLSDLIVFPVNPHKHPMTIQWGTKDHGGNSTLMEDMQCLGFAGDRLHGPIMFDNRWVPYTKTVAYIDPAGGGDDELALCIASTGGGYYWVHGVWGFPNASGAALPHVARLCREHYARTVHYESNADTFGSFGAALEDAMRREEQEAKAVPLHPDLLALGVRPWAATVIKDHIGESKERRIIATLEPVLSTHRLVIHPDALRPDRARPQEKELQYQLAYLQNQPKCLKHDDRIDVLASCVGRLVHQVPTARDEVVDAAKRMQDHIDKFNGRPARKPDASVLRLW